MVIPRRRFIKLGSIIPIAALNFPSIISYHFDNGGNDEEIKKLEKILGIGNRTLMFRINLKDKVLTSQSFSLSLKNLPDGIMLLSGEHDNISIEWTFKPVRDGFWNQLHIKSLEALFCDSIDSLVFNFEIPTGKTDSWYCAGSGQSGINNYGLIPVDNLNDSSRKDSIFRGVFTGSKKAGVFVGSYLPQKNRHLYYVSKLNDTTLNISCSSLFTISQSKLKELHSESTWICTKKNLTDSLSAYAEHLPILDNIKAPPVGWNSWDYYYSAITPNDILENIDAILKDPVLSQKVKYIMIDMGWEESEGVYYPNHNFPFGTKQLAADIIKSGFIPGIWTAPLWIGRLSHIGLRKPHMLLKNKFGDPLVENGKFVLDPTHPESVEYLKEIYSRLYSQGFRVFKIDYMDCIIEAIDFFKPDIGVFDVLREMYATIRSCIKESHIFSAATFPELGPGVLDSARTTIDIHNQWTHVEWGVEALQLSYWMHKRLFFIDPDFLIVRGKDTSIEIESNVTDPLKNSPNHPRWRKGPVFNLEEARSRASIVAMSGGSVVLSDRISKLNEKGLELIRKVIDSTEVAAIPLNLGDEKLPSVWYQQLKNEQRLTIINWADQAVEKIISFQSLGLKVPDYVNDFWKQEFLQVREGILSIMMEAHQSKVFFW